MGKLTKIAVAVSGIFCLGTVHAETTQEQIEALKAQVAELKQVVQQLSNEKKPQSTSEIVVPTTASLKPGWVTLGDGNTQARLYGNIRGDVTYDLKANPSATINNNTNSVPLNRVQGTKNDLNVSATASRLGVEVLRPTDYGNLNAKLEADFMSGNINGSGGLRLRHAYLSLGSWLFGQTSSPFGHGDTSPDTVDFNGPMGTAFVRTFQLRYTQPITPQQKLLVALEGGDIDNINSASSTTALVTGAEATASGGNRAPALTARYDLKTKDGKGLLQVHGLAHENRISVSGADQEQFAWGVGLGAKYDLTPKDTIFANYYHVKGDGRYAMYPNAAYIAHRDTDGGGLEIYESESDSASLAYSHQWSNKLRSTLAAGGTLYNDHNDFAEKAKNFSSQNKRLYNVLLNSVYTPVKNVDLGAEYTYGQRKTFNDEEGDYSRINFMARYNF